MKVTCQSCQAKYSIADEKVRGKIAKIRCKKCGTTIIVNGTAVDGATAPISMAPAGLKSERPDRAAADESWTVLVDDGDQRTLTPAQIIELFRDGTISLETHVWKDGMSDWLPIEQVDEVRSLVTGGDKAGAGAMTAAGKSAAGKPAASTPKATTTAATGSTRPATPAAAQAVARTEPRRPGRGGSTDLFGSSGGDDVLPNQGQNAPGGLDKPTGARNENSVLFSLSALTGGSPSGTGRDGGPGIEARGGSSTGNGVNGNKGSKLDDILNLGAGGIYAPALASAALAPPPVDEPAPALEEPVAVGAKPKSNAMLFAIGGIGAAVGAGVIAVAMMFVFGPKKDEKPTVAPGSTTPIGSATSVAEPLRTAAPTPTPTPTETAPTAATTEPPPTAAAPPTVQVPGAAATAKPPSEGASERPRGSAKASSGSGAQATAETRPPPAVPIPPPEKPAPPPAAAPASGGSFDRAAAISALSAIASAVQVCKRADGPTGQGRVSITFAPSGNATTANVEGPPFAGTPVGGCVAARFRTAKVPPFGGDPVTVHKSFSIN